MERTRVGRLALALLFVSALSIGLTATAFPRVFYDDFPFLTQWVELLPPYNEHLVTDVGGLYLGFAILFGWAAWTFERPLVRPLCIAWLVTASLHLLFHAGHLEGFGAADPVAEIASLALLLLPAIVALWACQPEGPSPEGERA
ncbi:MAG TPA: hypothetical protein VIT89_05540 [Solirubrobacterales bacterium]